MAIVCRRRKLNYCPNVCSVLESNKSRIQILDIFSFIRHRVGRDDLAGEKITCYYKILIKIKIISSEMRMSQLE